MVLKKEKTRLLPFWLGWEHFKHFYDLLCKIHGFFSLLRWIDVKKNFNFIYDNIKKVMLKLFIIFNGK